MSEEEVRQIIKQELSRAYEGIFRRMALGGASPSSLLGVALTMGPNATTMKEMTTVPAAPPTDHVVIYADDNGSGKTRIRARFATGAVQTLATQP